jgi:hypothetical protein
LELDQPGRRQPPRGHRGACTPPHGLGWPRRPWRAHSPAAACTAWPAHTPDAG